MGLVHALLGGRRGRRLLLEFALESEAVLLHERTEFPLHAGLFDASYALESARGDAVVYSRSAVKDSRRSTITPGEIAALLAETPLLPVTAELLRKALVNSVNSARYWQEPDGHDLIAGSVTVRAELVRVAEHLADSEHAAHWMSSVDLDRQWFVQWQQADAPSRWTPSGEPAAAVLQAWQNAALTEEVRAEAERPLDPKAPWGGEWWSRPPAALLHSTGEFHDESPVGLWCVEDGFGWEKAESMAVTVPSSARIFEIVDAYSWAQLCSIYPLEITAQKRHDWYRTSGRVGRWVIPDFSQMARDYDGVHLGVAAYLLTAGESIEVDAERASMVAGWNPDQTYWFTDEARLQLDSLTWECLDANSDDATWSRVPEDLGQ
ncbi:hypothetical protein [Paeniglutamicibacter sp. Y32M11]|uniref:hypothetical protein n=1 Tax=Paeniglutamicibacter sp. Y32M11 TaxID=2853258 RepID=UPI001C5273AD|nr:hypothetical protein [Paeniglutamicibacter sp. Y32M11]QXQ10159.1 hypothetical protein KUF55_17280 [Paeniglutamicibacter sp. Y32M11]